MTEHYRPVGNRTDARVIAQGYFCALCGKGGLSMLAHGNVTCEPNPELVHLLTIVNSPTWKKDRERLFLAKYHTIDLVDQLLE